MSGVSRGDLINYKITCFKLRTSSKKNKDVKFRFRALPKDFKDILNFRWSTTQCSQQIFHSMQVFHTSIYWCFFYWSLGDDKSRLVFKPFTSILADYNCTVVWVVLILPRISSSPSLFSRTIGTVPVVSPTIGTTVTFIFHSFFSSLTRSKYLSFHFFPFSLYGSMPWENSLDDKFYFPC